MTTDPTTLSAAEERAIDVVHDLCNRELAKGEPPAALAHAFLGYAWQCLVKAHGFDRAVRILRDLANDLEENPPEPAPIWVVQ